MLASMKQGNPIQSEDGYLSPERVAEITGLSVHTLAHFRMDGRGPAYHRIGGARRCRVLYSRADVDSWMARHRRTTSESREEAVPISTAPRRLLGRRPR